jgi:hypothetical protein
MSATGLAVVSLIIPAVGPATQASAVSCTAAWKWTSTTLSESTKMDATSQCDGLYAFAADVSSDYIKARYYKDGAWQTGKQGFVWITTSTGYKILGDTVTGRDVKGQSANFKQYVFYGY